MTTSDDGGFIHPVYDAGGASVSNGVTLRDWIAVYAPSPDAGSIASVLGWSVRFDRWSAVKDGEEALPLFDERWAALPHAEKMATLAKMRYAYADAMLRAREAKTNG